MQRFIRFIYYFFIVFIIYNTLIPFRIVDSPDAFQFNIERIMWIPFFRDGHLVSLTDILGNILLFIPFGFLGYIVRREKGKGMLLFFVTFTGFILSLGIETTQIFFIGRVSSIHDLITNTLGTLFGAISAAIYYRLFAERVFHWLKYFLQNEPITLIVVLILMSQMLGSLIPFNVTITVSDLKKSLKKTNIQPLGYQSLGKVLGLSKLKKKETGSFSWTDFIEDVLFFTIYGYLVFLSFYLYWKRKPWAMIKLLILLAVAFPAMELLQFFIKSRITDINDVLAGYTGALLGGLLILPTRRSAEEHMALNVPLDMVKIPVILYFIFVLYSGLNPFNFSMESHAIAKNMQANYLIPFFAYFKKTSIWNVYDILETLLVTLPIAVILKTIKPGWSGKRLTIPSVITGAFIALTIESAQLFLPDRTGDITDVILYACGGYLGVLAIYWYNTELLPQFSAEFSESDFGGEVQPSQSQRST